MTCSKQLLDPEDVEQVPAADRERGITPEEFRLVKIHMSFRELLPPSRAFPYPLLYRPRAGRKTRNSLAHSTRSLIARLELDSFYNESARFITSWLASCSRAITSQVSIPR